ncbi:MAG: Alpha/beta hydrolase fold-3 domain protein, partial [Lacunisphaera sp.]|nr:Alpha/beta hydrolase fold-3 domain protein [Lacunisphaera sp.]
YLEPFPSVDATADQIRIRSDIRYGDEEQQQLDVYLPTPAFRPPVVICWFGGAFWGADKSQFAGLARYLASRGIGAITPGYYLGARDGSRAAWPKAVYDAKSAVRYVRAHASELNVDPDRIVALGYSSGAYLAMMVGFTPNLPELEGVGGNLEVSSRVSAVIEISGVCDRRRDVGIPLSLLGRGYEEKPDLRVATSPVIYVSSKTVPVYILHGRNDSVADVSCATQLADALESARVPHVLRVVDADHAPITGRELDLIVEWLKKSWPARPE